MAPSSMAIVVPARANTVSSHLSPGVNTSPHTFSTHDLPQQKDEESAIPLKSCKYTGIIYQALASKKSLLTLLYHLQHHISAHSSLHDNLAPAPCQNPASTVPAAPPDVAAKESAPGEMGCTGAVRTLALGFCRERHETKASPILQRQEKLRTGEHPSPDSLTARTASD